MSLLVRLLVAGALVAGVAAPASAQVTTEARRLSSRPISFSPVSPRMRDASTYSFLKAFSVIEP